MKKWISIAAGVACILSSSLIADEALIAPVEEAAAPEVLAVDEQTPKQVGKAAADATSTAKSSNATKYVLAATAVAIGVTAIILVSRHHGHHAHSK